MSNYISINGYTFIGDFESRKTFVLAYYEHLKMFTKDGVMLDYKQILYYMKIGNLDLIKK